MKSTVLFLSCEHAANDVPQAYRHLFHQQEAVLQTHRGIDIGAADLAHYLSKSLHCEYTHAEVSRLLIDCNRSLSHASCFSEFSNTLSADEKQTLINQYYQPYRERTQAIIEGHIKQGYQVFHLSCHSFTPELNGITRNAGVGFLYDPARHGEKEVARLWHGLLDQQTEYRIRMNYPYRGSSDGFTTYLRKQFSEHDYLGMELEINQSLLLQDKASVDAIHLALSNSLAELLRLL
jgi:predicted N-formylglutamate amidohydrolase